jgi:hypothetical protein
VFISAASNLCHTLGYHRSRGLGHVDESTRATQERLFWTVYKQEKSLSLRLGRSSNFRDEEITLAIDSTDQSLAIARLRGRIYDQLYSVVGLSRSNDERGALARTLAIELEQMICKVHEQPLVSLSGLFSGICQVTEPRQTPTEQFSRSSSDQTRLIYLQSHMVCQQSLLAQVLKAIPTYAPHDSVYGSEECIRVSRECLEMHEQCIRTIVGCKNDPFMIKRYISW